MICLNFFRALRTTQVTLCCSLHLLTSSKFKFSTVVEYAICKLEMHFCSSFLVITYDLKASLWCEDLWPLVANIVGPYKDNVLRKRKLVSLEKWKVEDRRVFSTCYCMLWKMHFNLLFLFLCLNFMWSGAFFLWKCKCRLKVISKGLNHKGKNPLAKQWSRRRWWPSVKVHSVKFVKLFFINFYLGISLYLQQHNDWW